MPNIEIKANYPDLDKARQTCIDLGASLLWKDDQEDTYFQTQSGKMKLRESGLNGAELLPYVKSDLEGTNRSDYARIPIKEPVAIKDLLSQVLGKLQSVRKCREVYLLGNVRIHLDAVERLGNFLEFEAVFEDNTPEAVAREQLRVRSLMGAFDIEEGDLLEGSYPDLLI